MEEIYQFGFRDALERIKELGHLSKEEILEYAIQKSIEITKELEG